MVRKGLQAIEKVAELTVHGLQDVVYFDGIRPVPMADIVNVAREVQGYEVRARFLG